MIITLAIRADDFKLTQMLDKFANQYKVSYTLTRQNEHFVLRVKTNDLGELIRRLSHIKGATYKIQEMYETHRFSDMVNVNLTKTNIDALMGRTTTTYTDIAPIDGGLIKVVGELWFCRPKQDRIIKKGSPVHIVGVEGVSLIVEEVK
jgi:membrane-bound ClpP family serine protease